MTNAYLNQLLAVNKCNFSFVKLSEILIRTRGVDTTAGIMKKMHKDNAPIKIFAGGNTFALVDYSDIPRCSITLEKSIIVKSRGNISFEYYDKPFSHKNELWSYHSKRSDVNLKFCYYYLCWKEKHFQRIGSKMQMPQISQKHTDDFVIKLPNIEIQNEIVRILDKFTLLVTELKTELKTEQELRKVQYEYYRDQLLKLKGYEVEYHTLSSITIYEQPNKYQVESKEYDDRNPIPVLTAGKSFILGYTKELDGVYEPNKGAVIIFDDFTTSNKWVDFKFKVKSSAMKIISSLDENKYNLKYIYYHMQVIATKDIIGDHRRQWINSFSKKSIPIPYPNDPKKSLEIQNEIVRILDKFHDLTHSITEGLPKEIELRQQQYEYYRDLLLNFDGKNE